MKRYRGIQEETGGKKALQLRCRDNSFKAVSMALCHGAIHVLHTEGRSWIMDVRA